MHPPDAYGKRIMCAGTRLRLLTSTPHMVPIACGLVAQGSLPAFGRLAALPCGPWLCARASPQGPEGLCPGQGQALEAASRGHRVASSTSPGQLLASLVPGSGAEVDLVLGRCQCAQAPCPCLSLALCTWLQHCLGALGPHGSAWLWETSCPAKWHWL